MFEDFLEYRDGDLLWKVSRGRVRKGDIAGALMTTEWGHTYRVVRLKGVGYLAHRIIWEMHNGTIPDSMVIDHENGNTLDNSVDNLRLCTNTQNAQNIHKGRGIYSKLKGVSYAKKSSKFVAQIRVNGVSKWLGSFDTEVEAAEAYALAAKANFGEFANTGDSYEV